MNAIVSVTRNWGIGKDGGLLVRNKEDMRFFRRMTMGGTVLCGRTTFQSFPGGALKGRRNVVISANPAFVPSDAEVVRSVDEALAAVATENPDTVWLIGGQSVYEQLLAHCTRAYVTKHDVEVPADAFFPNLDELDGWRCIGSQGGSVTPEGIPYEFLTYEQS